MRISHERILTLQQLLNEVCGIDMTAEEAQDAGMAMIRFVSVKKEAKREDQSKLEALMREKSEDGQLPGSFRATP